MDGPLVCAYKRPIVMRTEDVEMIGYKAVEAFAAAESRR